MSVDALGNYLMTEAEIAAVQEGKTLLFYNQPFSIFANQKYVLKHLVVKLFITLCAI